MSHVKDLEELVELQAKAIEALKIALEVIQKSHAEKSSQKEIVFVQPSIPAPQPPSNLPQPIWIGDLPNGAGARAEPESLLRAGSTSKRKVG